MDPLHILLFALLSATLFLAVAYGLYKVVSNLYLDFLDFSRRFRGVE